MSLLWIWLIVFVLYARTLKYNYVIDDCVKREGYMYDVPLTAPPNDFFNKRPSKAYRLFMITMHCVNVSIVYMLWGWAPALLFAVHPLCVWGVAWVTGNYYATAAYFTLISYYIIHTFPNIWGTLVSMTIFSAALNSTVCPMTFPFLFLFIGQPWGLSLLFPLYTFLVGKKFTTGLKIRFGINNDRVIREKMVTVNLWRRPAVMTKVIARYISPCLFPDRLGFFDGYGRKLKEQPEVWNSYHSYNKEFWACFAVVLSVLGAGLIVNPFGIMWFFVVIMIHSQFNLTGQFYAQRYLYLSLVGLCIVVGSAIQAYPVLVAIVTTFLVIRTHLYIPAWANQECVWANDLDAYPSSGQVWNNAAQYYLQFSQQAPAHIMNKTAYYLFKAESMEKNAWEIQMNMACFFAKMGHSEEALRRTNLAIALLEPLGGLTMPIDTLKVQRANFEKMISEQKAQTNKTGATVSPVIQAQPEKEGTDDTRKRNTEGSGGSGNREPEGRKERLGAVA